MTRILFILLAVPLSVIAGCEDDSPTPLSPEVESLTTFDTDLEEWSVLDLGLAPGGSFGVVQEGRAWVFNDELTTATPGPVAQTIPVLGDLQVTAGPPDGESDISSEIRVAIGVRPETSDQRTYGLDRVLVRFVAASDDGGT